MGVEYHGTFDHTAGREGYSGSFDSYRIDDTNEGFDFTLEHETGKLVGIDLYHDLNHELKDAVLPIPSDPKANAEEQARQWAARLLDDPEDYEMIMTGAYDYWYSFRFVRAVNNKGTTDQLIIGISERGALANYLLLESGWTKEYEEELNILKSVPIEQLLREKTENERASLLSIQNAYYGRTPDKKVVLIVVCNVRTETGLETAMKYMISVD